MMSASEVKKFLSSYRTLKKAVMLKRKTLEDYIKEVHTPLMQVIGKLKKTTSSTSIDKITEFSMSIIEELEKDLSSTDNTIKTIFAMLDTLDELERNICYAKYISGLSWIAVADHFYLAERTVQRIENKAIKKIACDF